MAKRDSEAGYSGTPLPQKLGIRVGNAVAILGAPAEFSGKLGALPPGVVVRTKAAGKEPLDVIVAFVKKHGDILRMAESVRSRMSPSAGLWIAWPKKSSGVSTDVTENGIRDVLLPTGLVDNKVCAIDETWSGLRFVIRRELRAGSRTAR